MIKKAFFFLLWVGALVGLARFTHFQTRGFRIPKIENNFCTTKIWEPAKEEGEVAPWFHQTYSFLNRGLQSFVFVSEDQQYVIKIFNNRYQSAMTRFFFLSKLPFLKSWAQTRYQYYKNKLERTFTSYELAHEHFRDKAALVYTHLNPTDHLPPVFTIKDRLHIAHTLDLNQCGFVIQKKCDAFYPTLLSYIELGEMETAKKAIDRLIDLFLYKYEQGIADNDPLIRTNYGFLGGELVQMDVGPFSLDPSLTHPEKYRPILKKTTCSLKNWLALHSPELADYLEKRVE